MRKLVPLSVVVLVSLLSLERSADACSCLTELYPRPDDVMPLNGKLWLVNGAHVWGESGELWQEYCDSEAPMLVGPQGEIPLEFQILFDSVLVMTPTVQLEPETEYTLEYGCRGSTSAVFVTGTEIDDVPPSPIESTLVEVVHEPGDPSNSCGSARHYGRYEVNFELFPIVDVHADSDLDPVTLIGTVDGVGDTSISLLDGTTWTLVGRASCLSNWPEADYGQSAEVRFATIDLAGNFSGWSETVVLDMGEEPAPPAQERGCAVEPARAPAWPLGLGLAGLVLLAVRRRRQSAERC